MTWQEVNKKSKGYRFYKEMIENCDKNTMVLLIDSK